MEAAEKLLEFEMKSAAMQATSKHKQTFIVISIPYPCTQIGPIVGRFPTASFVTQVCHKFHPQFRESPNPRGCRLSPLNATAIVSGLRLIAQRSIEPSRKRFPHSWVLTAATVCPKMKMIGYDELILNVQRLKEYSRRISRSSKVHVSVAFLRKKKLKLHFMHFQIPIVVVSAFSRFENKFRRNYE